MGTLDTPHGVWATPTNGYRESGNRLVEATRHLTEIIEAALAARYADGAVDALEAIECGWRARTARSCREADAWPLSVNCAPCERFAKALERQADAHTRLETISKEGAT